MMSVYYLLALPSDRPSFPRKRESRVPGAPLLQPQSIYPVTYERSLYTRTLVFAFGRGDAGGPDLLVAPGRYDAGIYPRRPNHCIRPGPRSLISLAPRVLCRCGGYSTSRLLALGAL